MYFQSIVDLLLLKKSNASFEKIKEQLDASADKAAPSSEIETLDTDEQIEYLLQRADEIKKLNNFRF